MIWLPVTDICAFVGIAMVEHPGGETAGGLVVAGRVGRLPGLTPPSSSGSLTWEVRGPDTDRSGRFLEWVERRPNRSR